MVEQMHGIENSTKVDQHLRQVEDFVFRLVVLDDSNKAAAHYGDIQAVLERKGTPIGVNDLDIAGHARSEGLALVTNNLKEFDRVAGLCLENWVSFCRVN